MIDVDEGDSLSMSFSFQGIYFLYEKFIDVFRLNQVKLSFENNVNVK